MDPKRREFIIRSLQFAGVATFGGTLIASVLNACGLKGTPQSQTTANAIPNNSSNVYLFSYSNYSALNNVGGSVQVTVDATSAVTTLYVTRVTSSIAIAVSSICTYQNCTLNSYNPSTSQYVCPCCNSIFSDSGNVVQGPASAALASYTGSINGVGIQFTIP